jgi:hypothetical protein
VLVKAAIIWVPRFRALSDQYLEGIDFSSFCMHSKAYSPACNAQIAEQSEDSFNAFSTTDIA